MPAWLLALDRLFPIRYLVLLGCAVAALLGAFVWVSFHTAGWVALLGAAGVALGVRDMRQHRHSVLRNYPVVGHLRFLLELRFVPDYVLATLDKNLPEQIKSTTDQAVLASFSDPNLTTDQLYQRKIEHYEVKIAAIISLAKNKNFSSPAAAISYLRDNFIEHYEQLWFASTQSERLVLDALARGHFINMRKALPLRSLVRQGMVVLDPIPRPFSHSFALFVRQAERPDTIARWRTSQPKGQWESARLAAFLVLPLGLGALALAAVYNGDSLSTVLPALVAGAPALIGMVSRRATSLAQ